MTFVNDDEEPHTVTATNKSFDSEGLDTNQTWKHAFAKAGTFAYFCEMHPYMKGTVIVKSGGRNETRTVSRAHRLDRRRDRVFTRRDGHVRSRAARRRRTR